MQNARTESTPTPDGRVDQRSDGSTTLSARQTRIEIADFIAILTGLASVGFALYGTPITFDDAYNAPIAPIWLLFLGAGTMAVLGVVLAQRSRNGGRALVALAGALVLAAAFITPGAWVTIRVLQAIVGIVLLASSALVGPMTNYMPGDGHL